MATFSLTPDAATTGIGGMDEIEVAPARVVEIFGLPPSHGDVFCDELGRVFALSDWKATNLYDKSLPTPANYWARREPDELTISALDDDVARFKEWLLSRLDGEEG
jgi:hypothetical protein